MNDRKFGELSKCRQTPKPLVHFDPFPSWVLMSPGRFVCSAAGGENSGWSFRGQHSAGLSGLVPEEHLGGRGRKGAFLVHPWRREAWERQADGGNPRCSPVSWFYVDSVILLVWRIADKGNNWRIGMWLLRKIPWRRTQQATRRPVLCLENPMDRGAWRAAVHGVAQTQPRLNRSNKCRYSSARLGPGAEFRGSRGAGYRWAAPTALPSFPSPLKRLWHACRVLPGVQSAVCGLWLLEK